MLGAHQIYIRSECNSLRMTPRLNRKNVGKPNFGSKIMVKNACHVLLFTVATSLKAQVSENKIKNRSCLPVGTVKLSTMYSMR